MSSYVWFVVVGAVLAGMVALMRRGRIGVQEARQLLREGGVVVDVRSAGEFASGSVKGALNIPLERVSDNLAAVVPGKETPVLIHCQSGGRSGMAVGIARRAGYKRAFNLGSLGRARTIVEGDRDLC